VDSDVEAEELNERLVVAVAEERGEVGRVVLAGVDSRDLALAVNVTEDAAGNVRELGNAADRS
jgi:hypothetical protein